MHCLLLLLQFTQRHRKVIAEEVAKLVIEAIEGVCGRRKQSERACYYPIGDCQKGIIICS